MNRNLWGFNPKFKDFLEKKPDVTVIGVGWSFYWRFMVVVLVVEAILGIAFIVIFSVR